MRVNLGALWLGGSIVLMIVGAVAPWATISLSALGTREVSGTSGGGDGVIVLCAGLIGGFVLAAYMGRRWRRRLAALSLLAGIMASATTIHDVVDIGSFARGPLGIAVDASTGWGLYVALVGSIALTLGSLALLLAKSY